MRPRDWILVFAAAGFGISFLFSGVLGFSRDLVVLAYLLVGGAGMTAFLLSNRKKLARHLRRNWASGVLVGAALGALIVFTVTGQPGSPAPTGLNLIWSLVWLGLIYGLLDGLLLNVLPVLALDQLGSVASGIRVHLGRAAIALGASLLVTAAYHLGYREYRGPQLSGPLIGNAALTVSYLMTGNAVAPLLGHVIMHGAAVLHGPESTTQLPPHYPRRVK